MDIKNLFRLHANFIFPLRKNPMSKRLVRELEDLQTSNEFSVKAINGNTELLEATIQCSTSPVYTGMHLIMLNFVNFSGGRFILRIEISPEYPLTPPSVKFVTRIFHPNVDSKTGEVCLDILKSDWSPAWGISAVCRAVVALMDAPNADSPLNCDAGNLLRNGDIMGFNSLARMYTIEYAMN